MDYYRLIPLEYQVNMEGKICIVTGANTGIGYETALALAGMGVTVVMVCRNSEKGEVARKKIIAETSNDSVQLMLADMSSQAEIRKFTDEFTTKYGRLDVLVNNAGISINDRKESVDGIELVFATNVVGYFLLSNLLTPLLKESAPSRIVHVASEFAGRLDLDNIPLKDYNGRMAYQRSKQANRMISHRQAELLESSGVTVNCMSPGLTKTDLFRHQNPIMRLGLGLFAKSAKRGADTVIWLASSSDITGVTGKFYIGRKEKKRIFHDPVKEQKLWEICTGLTSSP